TMTAPAQELWAFAATLEEEGRLALDVLLRRAVDPVEAVATWPPGAFFTTEELALLQQMPRAVTPPDSLLPRWIFGHDMDYRGYVCAITKFTRLCNLRCIYCHDWRSGPNQVMPFEVQVHLISKLLAPSEHSAVDIIWHGGEPTLLGRAAFLRI